MNEKLSPAGFVIIPSATLKMTFLVEGHGSGVLSVSYTKLNLHFFPSVSVRISLAVK